MKKIGIWIDKEKAHIVTLEKATEVFETILSEVENYRPGGGSGTRFKGGPQDVVQDSKYLEREKHQLKTYFKDVITKIKDADAIAIFGPAETKDKLRKEISSHHKAINQKIKAIRTEDSMTDNQLRALVRDFYKNNG